MDLKYLHFFVARLTRLANIGTLMIWKLNNFVKTEENPRRPIVHNTINIPDHMVIAQASDIPEVSIKLNFGSIEEKTKGEVVALIAHMNSQGKFVSKSWVCDKLNFRERKADEIFTELKREGKIDDLLAVRHGRQCGYYYRIAGKKARRDMQRVHALMRRDLRASFKESFNSPKGSLENKEHFQTIPETGDVVGNEFEPAKNISLRHQSYTRNFEDGSPGNGLDGTQYTAKGCFERLTDPDNYPREYALIDKLSGAAVIDGFITPACARSAARRIDSGLINEQTVDKICSIIASKDLAFNLLDLVRNFEDILKENCETIRPGELDYIEDQIDEMTDGTTDTVVLKEVALTASCLKDITTTPEQLTYDDYINFMITHATLPVYAKMIVLCLSKFYNSDFIARLGAEYEKNIFAEMTANRAVYELVKNFKKFNFINWSDFASFRRGKVGSLCVTLYVNKMRNRKLDAFATQLNFLENFNDGYGNKHDAGLGSINNTPGDFDLSGSVESVARSCDHS